MSQYNVIVSTNEATVVSEYEPQGSRSDAYQSETALEKAFIEQLEKVNNYTSSDAEWQRFYNQCLANATEGIEEKSRKIQEDSTQVLKRDDGTT